jgi:hypothetical protein
MKRFLMTSALAALLALPVVVSADGEKARTPEAKWTSERPASAAPVENGQRRRVESTWQTTDAARSRQGTDAVKQSQTKYDDVNPSTTTD